jgi:putative PEP-CTERM system histidine kinase
MRLSDARFVMSLWLAAGYCGHVLAAILCASLAIHVSRRPSKIPQAQWLIVALALTALWSLRHSFVGFSDLGQRWDGVTETLRNAAWLAVLAAHLYARKAAGDPDRTRPAVLLALGALLALQLALDLTVREGMLVSAELLPLFTANWMLRCAFALGALFVLHGWTARRDDPEAARREAWVGAALACMWAYDFNHYILAWLTGGSTTPVTPMRGVVVAALITLLALGLRSDGTRDFAISRAVLSRLAPVAVVSLYVLVIVLLAGLATGIGGPLGRIVQFSLLFALAVAVLALLPSASIRSWLRVEISKHVFAHRYDYRTVWLKFAATMGASGEGAAPLDVRILRAIAETVDAPAAVLYVCDSGGSLSRACIHNWPEDMVPPSTLPSALTDKMSSSASIIDIAADWPQVKSLLPSWMGQKRCAWALAPLMHEQSCVGLVLLAPPPGRKGVDWEDQDVLRVVCGEAAARISEERNRAALAEAQRFDEFNRRFAFILHDLKNLVSQMTLLASNARRHSENPAFREDMILTLEETADRTSELLQRLNRPMTTRGGEPERVMIRAWVSDRVRAWSAGLGTVEVRGDRALELAVDGERLNRALAHLVRNAIEASPAYESVILHIEDEGMRGAIHIVDRGEGMSRAFVDNELFRPFSSTKPEGFGLGAHEARLLIEAMGGTLTVQSCEGEGTRFTVRLPIADASECGTDRPVKKAG